MDSRSLARIGDTTKDEMCNFPTAGVATQAPRNESLRAAVVRAFDTLADEVVLRIGPADPAAARQALSHVLVSTLHGLVILDGHVRLRSDGACEPRVSALECVALSLFGS